MEETEKVKIPTIKQDAVTSIEVSAHFYGRLKTVLFYIIEALPEEERLETVAQALKLGPEALPEEPVVMQLHTLMCFIKDLEESFTNNNLVDEEEIEVPKTQD